MDKLDFNNNGSLDYSEFLIAHLDAKLINEDRLREVFNLFDVDGSGTITADEIKKLLGGKGNAGTGDAIDVDDNEWEQILKEVDEDNNGEISFEEFRDMILRVFNLQVNNGG